MKIQMRERMGKTIDEMLSPDDNLVLRCASCQEYLLPREVHVIQRRVKIGGQWTFETVEQCPACYPTPKMSTRYDEYPPESGFIKLTREQFEITRKYERAGLIPATGLIALN